MTLSPALLSSRRDDWQTPPWLIERVRAFAPIGLDAACTRANAVCERGHYHDAGIDGLRESWATDDGQIAWCNPPYGRAIWRWTAKARGEWLLSGHPSILLVPARTDTAWWHAAWHGDGIAVCFLRGRLRFVGAAASAPFPSALIYYGDRRNDFAAWAAPMGIVARRDNEADLRITAGGARESI